MIFSHPLRILILALTVVFILGFSGCKSTPEPEPEETVVEEPADVSPPVVKEVSPEPLSDVDIKAARDAVQRANQMKANSYYPVEYRKLVAELNTAVSLGDADPDKARADLLQVINNADKLYAKTLQARKQEYEAKYTRGDDALKDINANKFAPVEYTKIHRMDAETLRLFTAGRLSEFQEKADETLSAQNRLHYNLGENIRYVGILRRDTENYIGDAEDNEAFNYSSDELEAANNYYLDGIEAFESYNITESAELLSKAKYQAILAARTSAVRKEQSDTDTMLSRTQQHIEKASRLETLDSEGVVNEASPWDGEDFLDTNPLIDHSRDIGTIDIENVQLRDLNESIRAGSSKRVPEDMPIKNSDTQVNADEQDTDYLAFAQTLWEKGIKARNAGQYELARSYFRQADAYISVYESTAVSTTYTVVYRDVATDCLWRISDRKEIFDNAYLWPKIWRANRRIIQNPDLIYPGQVLAIPPK